MGPGAANCAPGGPHRRENVRTGRVARRLLPPAIATGFVELIPGARGPLLIAGAGHFLQEDRPHEVAEAIVGLIAE